MAKNKGVSEYVKESKGDEVPKEEAPKVEAPAGVGEPTKQNIVAAIGTDEDLLVSGIVAGAGDVDEDEWEKTYLEIKSRGNYFDLIRNMYPLHLPEVCERMQEAKVRRYGWIGKENMEVKCEPSKIFYWNPVNHSNHPEIPAHLFNKHGGLMREGMYLCYMPWKMYAARQELMAEANRVKYMDHDEMLNKEDEFGGHFDPTEGGTRGAGRPGDVIMEEGVISHPDDSYTEAGEYEG